MSQFRVSTEALTAATTQTAQKAAEFESRVEAVRSRVSGTVGTGWSGAAAEGFHAGFQQWLSGASEVHQALLSLSAALGQSSGVYASTEQQVTAASDDSRIETHSTGTGAGQ